MNLQNEPASTISQTSFTTLALVGCRVAQFQPFYLEFFPVDGKMGPGAAERPLASIFPPQNFASVCKCNVQSYLLSMLSVNMRNISISPLRRLDLKLCLLPRHLRTRVVPVKRTARPPRLSLATYHVKLIYIFIRSSLRSSNSSHAFFHC